MRDTKPWPGLTVVYKYRTGCTEYCDVHSTDCDGFCDHNEDHKNGCHPDQIAEQSAPLSPSSERENNMMVWVVETGRYNKGEIKAIFDDFDSVSLYLYEQGISEDEIVSIDGESSRMFFLGSGNWDSQWVRITLHEVQ